MKRPKIKKKHIFMGLLAIVLTIALAAFWRVAAARTDIAFVNYQVITLGEISKANDNSFIKLHEAKLEDIDSWNDYDIVLINGMGLRMTEEQRNKLQEMTDKGLKVLTTAATNPANNIVSLDEWDADTLKQYLSEGGRKNLRSLLNYMRNEVDGKLLFNNDAEPVEKHSTMLLYHPDTKNEKGEDIGFASVREYERFLVNNNLKRNNAPRILITGQMGNPNELIKALEQSGDVVYATNNLHILVKGHEIDSIKPDAIINMAHGRIGDYIVEYLKKQNIPLFSTVNVNRMTKDWEDDKQGMSGGFFSQSIVMPEIDGMIRPFVLFAIREGADGLPESYTIPERLQTFVTAVNKHIRLKHIANKDKKVAIVYFKGPGANALTASGLDVVGSLYNLLVKMRKEGYDVKGLPSSAEALNDIIQTRGSVFGTYAEGAQAKFLSKGKPLIVKKEEFNTWTKTLFTEKMRKEMETANGDFPGNYLARTDGTLGLPVITFGNIAIMPQLPAGGGDDSFKMVHGTESAPPYPYIAQYMWIQEEFKADAMIHFGTHGSLEYTPGKQVALSQDCWSDRLTGTTPHFYLYTIGNVGEAMIAKRRTYAGIVSYLTPPFMESNLRGLYARLNDAIETYNRKPGEKTSLAVKAIAMEMGINRELRLDSIRNKPYNASEVARIEEFAEELMNEKINGRNYILGEPYDDEHINSSVMAMAAEPIAYSVWALEKRRKKASMYVSSAKELVAKLLNRLTPVTDDEICQIAHISKADLQRAHHIDSIVKAPQQMMNMMMGAANNKTMSHAARNGNKAKKGASSPSKPHQKMPKGMDPKKALAIAKMMGATPEQLKKMKEGMMKGKKSGMDSHSHSKMEDMPPAMRVLVDKAAEAGMLTKEEKEFSRAVLEVERTVRNVGNYRTALLSSPTLEIQSMLNALAGGYVAPSSGGDIISNPNAIPTGRNLFGVNAEACPSETAWERGKELAETTIRMYREHHNDSFPRKVCYTLWSGEFIETGGATIAQCLYMLGVEPIRDAFGRVTDIRLIPSKELGRPRIDIVVQTSGQLRDLAASRLFLLNRAVEMAAGARDDRFDNMVAEGVKTAEKILVDKGMSPKEAREVSTHRIFGGINGNYGTGIQGMTMASDRWEKEKELAEVYLNNMGAFYGKEDQWESVSQNALEAALARTDAVIQPRQSNTWGALSLDHVYEFMGGMNMTVRNITGKEPDAYLSDYRNRNHMRMQEVKEAIGVESRTTLFNPTYIKEKLQGGGSDVNTFAELVKNTFGWSVMKPEAIDKEMWDGIYDTYVKDQYHLNIRQAFEEKSPAALQEMTAVMMEAARKGYWRASAQQLSDIAKLHTELVGKYGANGSEMVGNNRKLQDFITRKVDAKTADEYRKHIGEIREETPGSKDAKVLKKEAMNTEDDITAMVSNIVVVVIVLAFIAAVTLLIRRHRNLRS